MDISRITKVILKNCQKIEKMTPLTVKNGILKKCQKSSISYMYVKVVSSAYLITIQFFIFDTQSHVNKLYNNGERIHPWGAPVLMDIGPILKN